MRKFLSMLLSVSMLSTIAVTPAFASTAPIAATAVVSTLALDDMDMDMDGVIDSVDSTVTVLPNMDMDMDGVMDSADSAVTPDYANMDMDMDGIKDFVDPVLTSMPSMGVPDVDMDGIVDTADTRIVGDMDMDGIADPSDSAFSPMPTMTGMPDPGTTPTPTVEPTTTPNPHDPMTMGEMMDMMMDDMDMMMADMSMMNMDMGMMSMDMGMMMGGGMGMMMPMSTSAGVQASMMDMPMADMDMGMMMDEMGMMTSAISTMTAQMNAMDMEMDMMMTMPMDMDEMMVMEADIDAMQADIASMISDQTQMASALGMAPKGSLVSAAASTRVPSYGAAVSISGKVSVASGAAVSGMPVVVKTGAGTIVARSTTGADGSYAVSVRPTVKTTYAIQSRTSVTVMGSSSASITIDPKVSLTRPSGPSRIGVNRTFTAIGYIKPKHTSGTYPVLIKAYRKVGTRWVLKKTIKAKASNYSTYTKYTAKVSLPARGSWKLVAFHDSATHAATTSSARYLSVR